jgi:hypothetical protein
MTYVGHLSTGGCIYSLTLDNEIVRREYIKLYFTVRLQLVMDTRRYDISLPASIRNSTADDPPLIAIINPWLNVGISQ